MNERMQEIHNQEGQPDVKVLTVAELMDEGKTEALAQQFLGNPEAMIKLFGREMTIAEMDAEFKKGITAEKAMEIVDLLGYRPMTIEEAKKVFEDQEQG